MTTERKIIKINGWTPDGKTPIVESYEVTEREFEPNTLKPIRRNEGSRKLNEGGDKK